MKCNNISLHSTHGDKPPVPVTTAFLQNSLTDLEEV